MTRVLPFCLFLLAALAPVAGQAQTNLYDERVTTAANIASTITNLGNMGNSFGGSFTVKGQPSCEYPANSGIEHLFDGGLWIGGVIGGTQAVSTGAVDDASGYSTGKSGYEFTATAGLTERSSLFDSPYYTPKAVSHQDFVSTFTDSNTSVNTGASNITIIGHTNPLDMEVTFESYNWNYSFANFFVILNYTMVNKGKQPIDSLYAGFWGDGVVRNVNITPPGGSAFFNKGGNGYIDSLDMAYEFDATGDVGYTDSYVGFKYLGADLNGSCAPNASYKVHYNTWQFQNSADPLFFYPTTDQQRYGKMTQGMNYNPAWNTSIQNSAQTPNNRSSLVSAGPFVRVNPGDTVRMAFAIVCARRNIDGKPASANTPEQRVNLIKNAGWAQTAYNGEDANDNCVLDPGEDRNGDGKITRFILPSPPDIPKMRVVSGDNKIEVYWANNAEASVDPISKKQDFEGYRLYKTSVGFDVQATQDLAGALQLAAAYDAQGNSLFFNTGFDSIRLATPMVFDDDTTIQYHYHYVFDKVSNGWQHVVALTTFDTGDAVNNLESLESAPLSNMRRVFPGKPANASIQTNEPFVYPNPYYGGAAWEGSSRFEEDRKIVFANLPSDCEIRVYSVAGDLIDVFEHHANTYTGSDIRWFNTYADPTTNALPGGEHAWDLLSQNSQIIARGLYLFTVTDKTTGETRTGRFAVVK